MTIDETGAPFPIKTTVSRQRVQDLLTTAIEGGTSYWAQLGYKLGPGYKYEEFREGGELQDAEQYAHPLEIIPFHEGCYLVVIETEEDEDDPTREHLVGAAEMQRALDLMAEKRPEDLATFLAGNEDADTGDVFLQLAALGEVRYG